MQRRDSAHASACLGVIWGFILIFRLFHFLLYQAFFVGVRSPLVSLFSPSSSALLSSFFFSLFLRTFLSENVFEFLVYGSPEIPSIALLLLNPISNSSKGRIKGESEVKSSITQILMKSDPINNLFRRMKGVRVTRVERERKRQFGSSFIET